MIKKLTILIAAIALSCSAVQATTFWYEDGPYGEPTYYGTVNDGDVYGWQLYSSRAACISGYNQAVNRLKNQH